MKKCFRSQAKCRKREKLRFACKRRAKNSENWLSLASEMQKTGKTTFRSQAKCKKREKQRFACKRRAKNGENSPSLVFFQQIDPKRAFLLAFFYLNINFLNLKTMELHQIYYSRLQNMEHFQFASHVAALCDEANIESVNAVLEPLSDTKAPNP